MTTQQNPNPNSLFRSRSGFVLIVFLAIIAFFLVTEHTAHFFGILPWLLLLACPLLHFLHGGHGEHGEKEEEQVDHPGNHQHNSTGDKS
jgi:heme/copper-type cytochrome/quinol oxidase subunit 4